MNKVINLKTRELLVSGIVGVMWILYGIMQALHTSKIIELITTILFIIVIIISSIPHFIKTEIRDEMAKRNMDKAKSRTYDYLMFGMLFCLLASIKDGWVIDVKLVISFLMGIGYLSKYIIFVISEKNGD